MYNDKDMQKKIGILEEQSKAFKTESDRMRRQLEDMRMLMRQMQHMLKESVEAFDVAVEKSYRILPGRTE